MKKFFDNLYLKCNSDPMKLLLHFDKLFPFGKLIFNASHLVYLRGEIIGCHNDQQTNIFSNLDLSFSKIKKLPDNLIINGTLRLFNSSIKILRELLAV